MKRKQQKGSALLTVLGITAIVSIVCGMLSASAMRQTRSAQITCDMLKARMIAESGLNKAYNAVKANFALASGYALSESFGGGTYSVRSVSLSNVSVNRAQLISEGVCGLGRSVVAADLENRPIAVASSGTGVNYPLAFDLLVGGAMTLKGNFHAQVTLMHANGNVDLSGSTSVDGGTISGTGTVVWKSKPSNVTLLPNQPAQVIYPASLVAAMNALKSYAIANGSVYATGASLPATPACGVAYCTGSDYGWSGNGTGCFIFEGSFSTKHMDLTSVNNYPVLVVLSPNTVQFNAGTVLRGTVLLPTSGLILNGHAEIDGPMLIGQTLSGNGTADLYCGNGQQFQTPPQQNNIAKVVITAWH